MLKEKKKKEKLEQRKAEKLAAEKAKMQEKDKEREKQERERLEKEKLRARQEREREKARERAEREKQKEKERKERERRKCEYCMHVNRKIPFKLYTQEKPTSVLLCLYCLSVKNLPQEKDGIFLQFVETGLLYDNETRLAFLLQMS